MEWGSEADMTALSANGPFDVVLASDCVYKQDLFSPLIGAQRQSAQRQKTETE